MWSAVTTSTMTADTAMLVLHGVAIDFSLTSRHCIEVPGATRCGRTSKQAQAVEWVLSVVGSRKAGRQVRVPGAASSKQQEPQSSFIGSSITNSFVFLGAGDTKTVECGENFKQDSNAGTSGRRGRNAHTLKGKDGRVSNM